MTIAVSPVHRARRLGAAACALMAFFSIVQSRAASARVLISIDVPPPPLPVYVQPFAPGPDFIWAPGYWAYDDLDGYYWVPGTWVRAPEVGLLWTPGYWGWDDGYYVWHAGYWGPHVGFYGGINYGCGYTGSGYWGGHWDHDAFFYNTSVTRVNTTIIHNTYNTVIVKNAVQRVSFNGGTGGIVAKPTAVELRAQQEHHFAPTAMQTQQQHMAGTNKALFASVNHGAPTIAATAKPGVFSGHGVVGVKTTMHVAPVSHATTLANAHPALHAPHTDAMMGQSRIGDKHVDASHAQHMQSRSTMTAYSQGHPRPLQRYAHVAPRPNPPRMAVNHRSMPHHGGGGHPHEGSRKPEHG